MIIAISSAPPFDTKKTAEKLAEQHGLKIIEDPSPQICRQYGFQTIYDMPQALQTEIRERLIREHTDFVKANDNLVLNFSVFEFLADWMRWFWANTPTEKWEEMMNVAAEAVNRYDEIYHVETGKKREYDGYVWFDDRNSKQINGLLHYLYSEFNTSDKTKKFE